MLMDSPGFYARCWSVPTEAAIPPGTRFPLSNPGKTPTPTELHHLLPVVKGIVAAVEVACHACGVLFISTVAATPVSVEVLNPVCVPEGVIECRIFKLGRSAPPLVLVVPRPQSSQRTLAGGLGRRGNSCRTQADVL